ncbi:MAG: HlyD family secretion protein, partial [Acidobacteriota bacterium]
RELERRIEACTIRAASSGVVISAHLERRVGEWLEAGGLLLELADASRLTAELQLSETEIEPVVAGATVELRLAAYPEHVFFGEVLDIAPVAAADPLGRGVFAVRASVHDPAAVLRPGLTGHGSIVCGQRRLGQIARRRLLRMIDPALL